MKRRALILLPAVAGCSVLPDRPYLETRRFALEPARPPGAVAGGRPALLLRPLRAGPGLEQRGLRRVRPDGSAETGFYEEWLGPPSELAEAALRAWLRQGGAFAAITASGSRLAAPLILEAELTTLDTDGRQGRAGLAALLLAEVPGLAQPRVLAQRAFMATAPQAGAAAAAQAAAMMAALGAVFAQVESWLVSASSTSSPGETQISNTRRN